MAGQLRRHAVAFPPTSRRRRSLDERLWIRFPFLVAAYTAAMLRLPRDSRLRRELILLWVRRSYEIVNRRDFDLAFAGTDPRVSIHWIGASDAAIAPDLVNTEFHGYSGFRRAWDAWISAFPDFVLVPEEVSDLGGNRLLVGIRAVGRGTASGALAEQRAFTLYTFRRGFVIRHEFFYERELAERAAGLA